MPRQVVGGLSRFLSYPSTGKPLRACLGLLGGRRMGVFISYLEPVWNPFLYISWWPMLSHFLPSPSDFLSYKFADCELSDYRALSLFAVAGGGVGMLLAFLLWDRHVVKDNVAWRFIAVLGIIVWGARHAVRLRGGQARCGGPACSARPRGARSHRHIRTLHERGYVPRVRLR